MHVYTAAAKGQKKEMTGGLNMGGKEARDVRLNRQTDEHCSGGKASSVGRDWSWEESPWEFGRIPIIQNLTKQYLSACNVFFVVISLGVFFV